MFLIQALEFLIKRIDERIAAHLKEDLKIAVGENPEKALVEHLKLKTSEPAAADFDATFSAFRELSIEEKNLDLTLMKFNITWQQLMEQNKAGFISSLGNALKEEGTAFNKLLVLNRFKRQLKQLAINARVELERREKQLVAANPDVAAQVAPPQEKRGKKKAAQDEEVAVEQAGLVDDWLCQRIKVSAAEAQALLAQVLANSKSTTHVLGLEFSRADKIGRCEVMVMACELALQNFYQTCLEIDQTSRTPLNDPGAMVDLLPGLWKQDKTITALNGVLAQDLLLRLFSEAEFKAYKECGLSEPRRLKSFPVDASVTARKIICVKARDLHEKFAGKIETDERVWQGLYKDVHDLDAELAPYDATTPLLYLRTKPQNPPDSICEGLHKMVETKGRTLSVISVNEHKGQCSKLRKVV